MSLTQRSHAEEYWGNSGQPKSLNGHTKVGLGSKLESFMDRKELPMYKDKPYNYAGSRKYTPAYRQKRVIGGAILTVIGLAYWFGVFSSSTVKPRVRDTNKSGWNWLSSPGVPASVDWDARREKVKEAFILSWDGYERYAWGRLSHARAKSMQRVSPSKRVHRASDKINKLMPVCCRLR